MPKKKLPAKMVPHQFKPGQSGNPKGRPPDSFNVIPKVLKELTVAKYREVMELVVSGNLDALRAMANDPNISALQVGVAKCMAKAMSEGDYATIDKMMERIVGKVPDEIISKNQNLNVNANASVITAADKEAAMRAISTKLEDEV